MAPDALPPLPTDDAAAPDLGRLALAHATQAVALVDRGARVVFANAAALALFHTTEATAGAAPFCDLPVWQASPCAADQIAEALADALRGRATRCAVHLLPDGGPELAVELRFTPVPETVAGDAIAYVTVEGREVTTELRLERERELLLAVTQAVSQAATLDDALAIVLREVCAATGWAYGEAWTAASDGGHLERRRGWHATGPAAMIFGEDGTRTLRIGEGLVGSVWATREPRWLPDVSAWPEFTRAEEARHAELRAGVAVPVLAGGEIAAVLAFFLLHARTEDPGHVRLVAAVAAQLGGLVQRRRAEDERRAADQRLAGIVSSATDAIISIDEAQRITLFNGGAERIFGYAASAIVGQPLDLLLPEGVRARHAGHVAAFGRSPVTARQMNERGEIAGRRRDGEIFPAEASISKLVVDGHRQYTVMLRDISERRAAERGVRLLSDASALLGRTLDGPEALDAIARLVVPALADLCVMDLVDDDGRVRRAAIAGGTPALEERARALIAELPPVRDAATPVAQALRTREPVFLPTSDDEWTAAADALPAHRRAVRALGLDAVLVVPLVARGHVVGALSLATARDAGPVRARLDARGRALAEELAARVALAVDNARLYRQATHAVALRDNVLAVVSHDLRNPLSAILMCSAALLREREEGTVSEHVGSLVGVTRQSAEWMQRIIRDLLDVSSIEAGGLSIDRERVDPLEILEAAHDMARPLAAERRLALTLEVPAPLPPVEADLERIVQVLLNLVGNAVKFTDEGGTITLAAAPAGHEVRFVVRDTGCGIPEEELPRIFERFWHARRGAKQRGTGLGLAIAKGIVDAHGGRIWVESTVGSGSSFHFTLPVSRSPVVA